MKHLLIPYLKTVYDHWSQQKLMQPQEKKWCRDPLSHPDIQRMSERERADIQFRPYCVEPE